MADTGMNGLSKLLSELHKELLSESEQCQFLAKYENAMIYQ